MSKFPSFSENHLEAIARILGEEVTGSGRRFARIASVDYAQGIVTLDRARLTQEDEGRWVPVRSASHEASVRIEKVLSPTRAVT